MEAVLLAGTAAVADPTVVFVVPVKAEALDPVLVKRLIRQGRHVLPAQAEETTADLVVPIILTEIVDALRSARINLRRTPHQARNSLLIPKARLVL